MMKEGFHIIRRLTVFVTVIGLLTGCRQSIETCECSRADIYGFPIGPGVHLPLANYEDDIREMKPLILTTTKQLDSLKSEIMNLEKSDFQHSPFDTHLVLDLHCNSGKTITVLSNNILLRYNGTNYEPSDTYNSYMARLFQNDVE